MNGSRHAAKETYVLAFCGYPEHAHGAGPLTTLSNDLKLL